MAVTTAIGAAGGGASQGSVPQAATTPVDTDEGSVSGSSGPQMATVAIGAAGGGAGRGSVLQATTVPIGADEGDADGSSGAQMPTTPVVREAGGGASQGSCPQGVAFTSTTSAALAASGGGGSTKQTVSLRDSVQGAVATQRCWSRASALATVAATRPPI
jgi:hypothetical protein